MQEKLTLNDRWTPKMKSYINTQEAQRKIAQITQDLASPIFLVDLDYLRREDFELCAYFLCNPTSAFSLLEKLLVEYITEIVHNPCSIFRKLRLSVTGNFGSHNITPRMLKARFLSKLIKVQGVAISVSSVRSRLVQSTHFCMSTQKFITQQFGDQLGLRSTDLKGNSGFLPLTDTNDNPVSIEFGLSRYKDVQVLQIQENPETVPSGLLSRSVEVILQEELVEKIKPGDSVEVIGILRAHAGLSGIFSGFFNAVIQAFDVSSLNFKSDCLPTPAELKEIKIVAKRPDLIELLRRSFAPSISGLEGPKEASLLLLVGGEEKTLPGGIRLRGDVNVLLVGDPSTAKSQLLRWTMTMSSNAFSANGRGSSGVGLTAAISVDRDSKEKKLEAGAMVLADRGLLCIDEFDKMAESDRIALHEAMEQQTVSLAKAGVQVCLNARCTVFAAANPAYGNYIPSLSHARNISLPETLLSRFDLIFVVLDLKNPESDRDIARCVTGNHRISAHNYDYCDRVFSRQDSFASGGRESLPLLSASFLRKYLLYIKQKEAPLLSDEASIFLRENWILLRKFDHELTSKSKISHILPVTIRSLESLIRLATAYAKLRLSPAVGQIDCGRAISLFLTSFYGGFDNQRVSDCFSHIYEICHEGRDTTRRKRLSKRLNLKQSLETLHYFPGKSESSSRHHLGEQDLKNKEDDCYRKVFRAFIDITQQKRSSSVPVTDFFSYIEENRSRGKRYGITLRALEDLDTILNNFAQKNKILISEGVIYKI